jgi:hypothetical protein
MKKTPMEAHRDGWSSFFNTDKEAGSTWRKEWPEWGDIFLFVLFFSRGFLDLRSGRALPGTEAEVFQILDQVLINSLHSFHQFPQWNFYILGGLPYAADPMFHSFNPVITLPVLALGALDGYKVALFLSLLLAALGAWRLGKAVGMGPAGRLWSACLFVCAGQPAIRFTSGEYLFIFGFAWIPWALAGLIEAIRTRRRVHVVMAVLSLALVFLSGNVYYAVYMLLIIGLLAILLLPRFRRSLPYVYPDRKKTMILIVIGVLAFGLVAVQALPLFGLFPRLHKDMSQRDSQSLQQIVLDLTSTKIDRPDARENLPVQEYYSYLGWGPLLALLLLPLAIWNHPQKRLILFFAAMLALSITMIDASRMPWKDFFANTPFLSQFHLPTRALILCSFAVIMLSGFVMDSLWNLPDDIWKERIIKFRVPITGIFRLGLAVLIIMIVSDTFRTNEVFLNTTDPLPVLTKMMQWLRRSDPGVYYVDVFADYPMSGVENNLWLLDPWYHFLGIGITEGAENTRPVNAYPQYLLTDSQDPVGYPDPIMIQAEGVYAVFKLPHSLPFAFTLPNARLDDPSNPNELTLEEVTPAQAQLPGADRVEITATGDQPGTLVVLASQYPGWQVTADGRPTRLLNIDGHLGADLKPGKHTYEFTFRSIPFLSGLGISLLSLLIVIGLLVGEWRNEIQGTNPQCDRK